MPRTTVSVVDDMYCIKGDPEDNWIWFAFTGFTRLARTLRSRNPPLRTSATIGTGNGLDAIGAAYASPSLERIVVTDVDDEVVRLAVDNVRRNVPAHIEVTGLTDDVCGPLAALPFKIDVILR